MSEPAVDLVAAYAEAISRTDRLGRQVRWAILLAALALTVAVVGWMRC